MDMLKMKPISFHSDEKTSGLALPNLSTRAWVDSSAIMVSCLSVIEILVVGVFSCILMSRFVVVDVEDGFSIEFPSCI